MGGLCLNIERWLRSFINLQGIWASINKEPFNFVILQGVGDSGPPVPLHLDPRMQAIVRS